MKAAVITSTDEVWVHPPSQPLYAYQITESLGQKIEPSQLTPAEMLYMGVFGGAYLRNDGEFPTSWFKGVRLSKCPNPDLNYYGVLAGMSKDEWQKRGWIHEDDPLGWFQWYCRYYIGRRHPDDGRQILRYKRMRMHVARVVKNCRGNNRCRERQRQALLQWSYDATEI